MDSSLRDDRILVMKSPAAEKALSASAEVGGTVKIAVQTFSIHGAWIFLSNRREMPFH